MIARVLRRLILSVWTILVLLVALYSLLLKGCISEEEVARVRSPSGKVEARLVETNGGATTAFGYSVYLHPVGPLGLVQNKRVAGAYAVQGISHRWPDLVWTDAHTLEVRYLEARQAAVERPAVTVGGQRIRVRLRGGAEAAPLRNP